MQVIAGKFKGMKLATLEGKQTRPTLTRIKEDAFNIINNYFIFDEKKSLDIFGGSGALTIEGLSRGIGSAVINDYAPAAINIIKHNLNKTKQTNFSIVSQDYLQLLTNLANQGQTFDLIYMDPPFVKHEAYQQVFTRLIDDKLLNMWGMIMLESEQALDVNIMQTFRVVKHKDYKKKHLYILRLEK